MMKSRRGIASVVGTVFAIIALATTVGYITYSMNVLDNYNQAVLARNQQATDTVKEKFALGGVSFTSGSKLNMTIQNTGSLPINITKIWITNKTSTTTAWVKSYTPSNAIVAPGKSLIKLGFNDIPVLNTNYPYHIKLVTSRGNTQEFDVTSTGTSSLDIRLYALPPTIVSSFSTELIMVVINNSTNGATLTNITPSILDNGCQNPATPNGLNGPVPTTYPTLSPGQSAYFKWDLSLTGNGGTCRSYTVSLVGGVSSNTATTTVSIITVPVSLQSGTAVQSLGLSANTVPTNTLILHKETNTSPANTQQLWSGSAETAGGTTIVPGTSTTTWITNNDSSSTLTVPVGSWVFSNRYVSDKVPTGFSAADLIYHFDTLSASKTKDSSGNTEDLTAIGAPTLSFTGVNSSNAIPLSGSGQYFSSTTIDTHTNPYTNTLTSTAGWFKTSGSVSSHKTIVHFGKYVSKPFYDVGLSSSGKVVFSFSGQAVGSGATTCTSSGATRYDDQKWHHFVAEKTGINSCLLYVDALSSVSGTGSCGAACANAITGGYFVGNGTTVSGNTTTPFPGTIDDVMHWNNAQLTALQAAQLTLRVSYGNTAHTLNMELDRVDPTNTNVYQVINQGAQAATFPFYDPITNNNVAYNTGASANYTYVAPSPVSFNPNDRLRLVLNWSSGMNMTIQEDSSAQSNPLTTFLQVPGSTTSFPGYLTYTIGASGPTLYISNAGPNAAWLSALTRLAFTPVSGGTSYEAAINTINSTYAISASRDGPLFQVGQTEVLNFYPPSNPACAKVAGDQCNSGFTTITAGNYRLSAFLSGVDNTGQIFLRTVYIGPIKVQ